ncbi:myosin-10-like [Anneissia japonica]|uniref:myosin-10-like n=1 Tax=Anneissia japonica TaxID=1529436 RepID=UPI001425AB02|nr:myosin-10-like [Anneissia japonica]
MSALRESSDVRSIAEEEVERLKTELASKTDALKERNLDVVRLKSDLKAARRKSKQPPPEESGLELQQKLQEAVRKLKDQEGSHADLEEELEEKDDKISALKKESTLAKTAMSMYEKRVDVLEENLKTACKRYDEEVKSRRIVEAAAKKADEHAQSMADKKVELQRELLRRQPEESLYEMEVNLGEKEELRRAHSDLEKERKTVMRLKSAIKDLKKGPKASFGGSSREQEPEGGGGSERQEDRKYRRRTSRIETDARRQRQTDFRQRSSDDQPEEGNRRSQRRTSCRKGQGGNSREGTQRRRRPKFGDAREDKRRIATGEPGSGGCKGPPTTVADEAGRDREAGGESEGTESRRMKKQLSDKDRTAIDLRNEIDTLEEKMKRNGSKTDDPMTAYKEEIERNVKRMKELDATIAKKIREAAGLEDEIAVMKEGRERDGRKIKRLVEIPQWKQWVEELKKARDESHESHAKELGSLREDLEREKSDAETKLATAKASNSDEIENLRTQISFLKEKESKLKRDAGKFHAHLKEREEKHLDRIAKLESDKISRSAEAEQALDECASFSGKLKLATENERRSKEDLERWQAKKRSWQATVERRSADLDKLRDLLKTSEKERANLQSQHSNVDKNVTDSKETDSLKRELERHRQEIRQLERLLSDEKREKSEAVFSKNKEADELRSDLTKTKMDMDEIKRQLNFVNNKVAEAYSEVTRIVENSEDGRSHEECRDLLTRRLDEVERSLENEKMKAADCAQFNKELMRQISYLTNEIETVNYGRSVEVSKLRRLLNDCRREGSQRQRREHPGRRNVGSSYYVDDACSRSSACESEEEVDDDE